MQSTIDPACSQAFEAWAAIEQPPPSAAELAWRAWRAAWVLAFAAGAASRSDTLPCPVFPGPTEHEGELCDDCAAYVGAASEVSR